jgi:hypothetical protein
MAKQESEDEDKAEVKDATSEKSRDSEADEE